MPDTEKPHDKSKLSKHQIREFQNILLKDSINIFTVQLIYFAKGNRREINFWSEGF